MAILERLHKQFIWLLERRHLQVWHRVLGFYTYLLILWGFYRVLSPFPVWVEEVVLKGLVFGLPVFWLVFHREKEDFSSLGITMKNFYQAVCMGLSLGILFWGIGQLAVYLRSGELSAFTRIQPTSGEFGAFLLLALVTAWWEELVFTGYILGRLARITQSEFSGAVMTAMMFGGLYLPALLLRGNTLSQTLLQLFLLLLLGFSNSVLMLRTGNLIAPILSHAFWGVTVYLLI